MNNDATRATRSDLFVSVVAPVRNAAAYVADFVHDVSAVLGAHFKDFEIVLVDDRSQDNTVETIEQIQTSIKNVQLYCLARRIGMDSAFVVGMEHAIGDVVVTIDSTDDPPASIMELVASFYEGNEIVYGVRSNQDWKQFHQRVTQSFFQLYRSIAKEDVPSGLSNLRLMSRRIVNTFADNRDRYNLFPVLAAFTGVPYACVSYSPSRRHGAEKDARLLDRMGRAALLLLLSSKRPLRWITFGSLVGAMLSFSYGIYVVFARLFSPTTIAEGWTSLSLQIAGLFFVEFIVLAIMSEYLIRIFVHTQNRPPYLIVRDSTSLVLSRKEELNVIGANQGASLVEQNERQ